MDFKKSTTGFLPHLCHLTHMRLGVIGQLKIVVISTSQLHLGMIILKIGENFSGFSQIKKGIINPCLFLIDCKAFIDGVIIIRIDSEKMVSQMTSPMSCQVVKGMVSQIDRTGFVFTTGM